MASRSDRGWRAVGYLGPNGAGKSTTIKMLTGILVPSSGEVNIGGHVPWKDRVEYVRGIGVVFGQRTNLWWDLPVIESLDLLKYVYRIPEDRYEHNLREFRELLGLDEFLHTPVRSLSLGQRMRADLAGALLHDPRIIFLDEPTIGLDVVARAHSPVRQIDQSQTRRNGYSRHAIWATWRSCASA
jgi:ABC-2 type transport system ATP-binding protein